MTRPTRTTQVGANQSNSGGAAVPPPLEAPKAKLALGQVGFLEVTDEVPFGVFVDIGLPKELLVPFAEQTCEMRRGQSYAIGIAEDNQGRLIGTQRIAEMLREAPPYSVDDWVEGQAWRREAKLGVFIIVEKQYLGLLPESEPHDLKRGMTAKFRVSQVLTDGKIQLSLRRKAFEEMDDDAERVLTRLTQSFFRVSDQTDPDIIRARFGLSKKAYKRAIGRLIKRGMVSLDADGYVVLSKK
jgi:predicted RNA-binding protein (virulence factor B family)